MAKSLPITANRALLLPVRNTVVKMVALCAAAATSTLEVFDGVFGTIATIAVGAAGTGYTALDVLTLVSASSGVQATVRVDTVDVGGEILTVTLLSGGTGYLAGSTYATTGGTGSGGTITASTVTDGTLMAKLSCVANENAPPTELCALSTLGISVRITGTNAKGHLYYD